MITKIYINTDGDTRDISLKEIIDCMGKSIIHRWVKDKNYELQQMRNELKKYKYSILEKSDWEKEILIDFWKLSHDWENYQAQLKNWKAVKWYISDNDHAKRELDKSRAKAVPIESLVLNSRMKKFGNRITTICPFHKEGTPSFTIYTDTNTFKCYGCQEQGDAIDFVQKYHGVKFKDALKFLLR